MKKNEKTSAAQETIKHSEMGWIIPRSWATEVSHQAGWASGISHGNEF